jgi:hypothetical protein
VGWASNGPLTAHSSKKRVGWASNGPLTAHSLRKRVGAAAKQPFPLHSRDNGVDWHFMATGNEATVRCVSFAWRAGRESAARRRMEESCDYIDAAPTYHNRLLEPFENN